MPIKDPVERKEYIAAYHRIYYATHKVKHAAQTKSNTLKRWDKMFGLDLGSTEWALAVQQTCMLCGEPFQGTGLDALAKVIDHDHITGRFRGIIHKVCNTGIGNLRDSVHMCIKAAEYLGGA